MGAEALLFVRGSFRLLKVFAHNVSQNSLTCLKYPSGSSSSDLNLIMNIINNKKKNNYFMDYLFFL